MPKYAWIITVDKVFEVNEAGTIGPSDVTDEQVAQLEAGKGHTFYMWDDDRIMYYKGRMVGDIEEYPERPLWDFGGPNAGCTLISWHGRKDLDCEY